jgi:intracellular multiplication protein IcmP
MADPTGPHPTGGPAVAVGILGGVLMALAIIAWVFAHAEISAVILAWKHLELGWIGHVTSAYQPLDEQVVRADPSTLTLPQMWRLFSLVGEAVRVPAVVLLAALSVLAFTVAPSRRFRRPLDQAGLVRAQAEPFRCASAFLGRRQEMVAPRDGAPRPSDFSLHVGEWIRCYAWDDHVGFREDRARRELARQLGPIWSGPENAPGYVRCLFAACALHAARHRDDATSFLGDLAQSLPRGERPKLPGDVVARADRILRDGMICGPSVDVAARHAFQSTAMLSVLAFARQRSGVLAPAQFNWLKLVDRRLWYALHSLGMPNPLVEALGARAHWAAECLVSAPIHVPSVDRAAAAIRAKASEGLSVL